MALAGIWKQHCHTLNQHSRIRLIAKFPEIGKMPKIGTRNALFVYFWAKILENYYHIWKQHPLISLIAKFRENTKMAKFETKTVLFG